LPDPGANPGRGGGKPATNRFSYGAATLLYRLPYSVVCRQVFAGGFFLCTCANFVIGLWAVKFSCKHTRVEFIWTELCVNYTTN
jgi:hypothetical protein